MEIDEKVAIVAGGASGMGLAILRRLMENDYLNGECIRTDAGLRMQPR